MTTDCDILVIGAGILGVSCAYHLKKSNPGKEILLIDRFEGPAQGNTARSAAMFRTLFTSPDNLILAESSINFYVQTQSSGVDLGMKMIGYLWLMSERQLSRNEPYIRKMESAGIDLKRYDRSDLKRMFRALKMQFSDSDQEPRLMQLEDVAGAVFGVKCGQLDPDKLSRYYFSQFTEIGGKSAFGTRARKIVVKPSEPLGVDGEPFVWQDALITGVEVEGKLNGEIRAETTVVASGVWNNELLEPIGIDGHVKGKKRQIFTISAAKDSQLSGIMHNSNFNKLGVLPFVILPKSACFIKSVPEEGRFWVACDDDLNQPYVNVPDADLDNYKAEPEYYRENVYRILKSYLPEFEGHSEPDQMWSGLYSYNTLDSMPFVFLEKGMIVAGGGSGSGIMKGDAMGRLVDAAYRLGKDGEATLYGDVPYRISKIGFESRNVQREEWVI
ncbi:MAG TPA: FAD-binding oxidoreductase [Nitrososphaerales archaeon]|nr:FAD-binding oxidoreductase [Nitrososphaerales archaeon]